MDISSIRAGVGPKQPWTVPAAPTNAPVPAQQNRASAAPAKLAPPKSQPLDVHIETRPDGGRQLTIKDKTTGQIYCQLPPERVVQLLEEAMRRMEND